MLLPQEFFLNNALQVAPALLGKKLVRRFPDGSILHYHITETEAYCGEEDMACHASKGKTPRTSIMYEPGGSIYMYLIYGMYWMLNFVTGEKNNPQAVLIRGIENYNGPGKLTRALHLDRSFYGIQIWQNEHLWVEETALVPEYTAGPRVGVSYAGDYWGQKPWRFMVTGFKNASA